jgi:micrococcal nuclease
MKNILLFISLLFTVSVADDITVDSVLKVYSGTTFSCNVRHCGCLPVFTQNIVIKIDVISVPDLSFGTESSKKKAKDAKYKLNGILRKAKCVSLSSVRRDKHFNLIADVYADNINVAKYLIQIGDAKVKK